MWKTKFGIAASCTMDNANRIFKMLKQIGFDAVSPDWNKDIKEITESARNNGLEIHYLHAPFSGAAKMWSKDDIIRREASAPVLSSLEDCARNNIPILVIHCWIGFDYVFSKESLSYDAYDELVQRAEALGVTLAFENTEGEEYLYELMERYKDINSVGFCWDSGHEMCYNRSQDLLAIYGDRLVMTHINDNLGISRYDGTTFWTDDLHLLPYDGVADWSDVKTRLQKSRKQEYLNLELSRISKPDRHENDKYLKMSDIEYYTEAYARLCKLAYGM